MNTPSKSRRKQLQCNHAVFYTGVHCLKVVACTAAHGTDRLHLNAGRPLSQRLLEEASEQEGSRATEELEPSAGFTMALNNYAQ